MKARRSKKYGKMMIVKIGMRILMFQESGKDLEPFTRPSTFSHVGRSAKRTPIAAISGAQIYGSHRAARIRHGRRKARRGCCRRRHL